jgi:hypothetical protein
MIPQQMAVDSSYLMLGPPDLDIKDMSFKFHYIMNVSQSFSNVYDGFGHAEVHQWLCMMEKG